MRGGAAASAEGRALVRPSARSVGVTSRGARVATTGRVSIAAGGRGAEPLAGVTLAATGRTSTAPRTGWSSRAWVAFTRSTRAAPRPN